MQQFAAMMWLSESEMKTLHERTLDLLADVGIFVDHDRLLTALEAAGAAVDSARRVARIPREVTHRAVESICGEDAVLRGKPFQPALLSRPPEPLKFDFGGTALKVTGDDGRTARTARYADLERLVRFGDGHPRIQSVGGPPVQMAYDKDDAEIPAERRVLEGMTYLAKHCAKPGVSEIDTRRDVLYAEQLNEIVGRNSVSDRHSFLCVRCTITPLRVGFETADVILALAERNLPLGIAPMPLPGGSTPVTVASSLLIANAEILGLLTAVDCVRHIESVQGHIMLSGVMDMRSGGAIFGTPDAVLQDVGMKQLYAYYYDIPVFAPSDYIDAPFPSYQSGYERAMKIAATGLTGCLLPSVGQLGAGLVCSPTQACLDMEAFDWIAHAMKGIEISEETLCFDLIRGRGVGGDFLSADHTVQHFRQELFAPVLASADASDGRDMVERAAEQAESIIASTPLFERESDVLREIEKLYRAEVAERDRVGWRA